MRRAPSTETARRVVTVVAGDTKQRGLADNCGDIPDTLVVVRRGLGEAPRYRRAAPPNRRQTAAAHCKRAGGILKPPPLLGV